MLQTHYRSPLDFSDTRLKDTEAAFERLQNFVRNTRWICENNTPDSNVDVADMRAKVDALREEFVAAMDDDFNSAGGMAAIFGLVSAANKYLAEAGETIATAPSLRAADMLCELCGVLGINLAKATAADELPAELITLAREQAGYEGSSTSEAAKVLLEARQAARAQKNWAVADAIRNGITALGLVVEDTATGARLRAKE